MSTDFDLRKVQKLFSRCHEQNLDLESYVEGYVELNKFFSKLGSIFKFIVYDISEKTEILSQHLKTPPNENRYRTVQSMLDYEIENNLLLDPAKQPAHRLANGSRTLLRLHRALLFVGKLTEGFLKSDENDRMAPVARSAYDETLARYHPWLIRKAVHLAVHTLPHRQQFMNDLAGTEMSTQEAQDVIKSALASYSAVYEGVQKLYADRNLLDLP